MWRSEVLVQKWFYLSTWYVLEKEFRSSGLAVGTFTLGGILPLPVEALKVLRTLLEF